MKEPVTSVQVHERQTPGFCSYHCLGTYPSEEGSAPGIFEAGQEQALKGPAGTC